MSTYVRHSTHVAVGEQLSGVGSSSWVLGPDSDCQACREGGRAGGRGREHLSRFAGPPSFLLKSSCVLFSTLQLWATAAPWPHAPANMSPHFLIFHRSQSFCCGKQASSAVALQCRLFILLFGASTVSFPPVIAQ